MDISLLRFVDEPNPGPAASPSPTRAYVDALAAAAADGFTKVWTPQLAWDPDVLTLLAHALHEVPAISVGTGVVPIQTRHPAVLAQQALTVASIAPHRLTLGIGMAHPVLTEGLWGIPWTRHVRRLTEYLDGLLPLLDGERVDAEGEIVTTRGGLRIPGAPAPDVYVAALGPKLLDIAGRRTAGTITWMTGPRTLGNHIVPTLRRAAGGVDRTVRVVAGLIVCVTDDAAAARERINRDFAAYGSAPSYRAMLDREGVKDPADVAIVGNETAVADQLDGLADLGVDEVAANVVAADPDGAARTRSLLRAHGSG